MAILTLAEFNALVPSSAGMDSTAATIILDGVTTAVEGYCNTTFGAVASYVEYKNYPPPGSKKRIKLRYPVTGVTEVKFDPQGGYGQITDSFGTTTILTAGQDYVWDAITGILTILRTGGNSGGGWAGSLVSGGYFAYGQPFAYNTNIRDATPGAVKVTYTAGWSAPPNDVKLAAAMIAGWLAGGALESGGRDITHYIDTSATAGAAMDALGYGNSPTLGSARQLLGKYRTPLIAETGW